MAGKKIAAMAGVGALSATVAFSTVVETPAHSASDRAALGSLPVQSLSATTSEDHLDAYADVDYAEAPESTGTSGGQGSKTPSVPEGDHAAVLAGVPNGSMPDELLADLSFTSWQTYRGVAPSFEAMNAAYRADTGSDLAINNVYRPGFQGRSFHGWGLAVDFNGASGTLNWDDAQFHWLMEHAHEYGFYLPMWAGKGGSNPEPWHWEFGSYYGLGDGDCASRCPANRQLWVMD